MGVFFMVSLIIFGYCRVLYFHESFDRSFVQVFLLTMTTQSSVPIVSGHSVQFLVPDGRYSRLSDTAPLAACYAAKRTPTVILGSVFLALFRNSHP